MDEREWFGRLDATVEDPPDLFEHFERRSAAGHTSTRSRPPATASSAGETVAVEEQLDGFNVRIADAGEPLAFTRSGYVCPYTTARARELLDLSSFFADHPKRMLCAELVGPETPYTTHDYEGIDAHAFRVFGVRDRESGDPLPVSERRELRAAYDLPQPRLLGRYETGEAVDGARRAIDELDAAGREGVVMKSADGTSMLKYTTESQHHAELAYAFSLPFERGRDFLFSRVLRGAFQAAEVDGSEERLRERARDLGESTLRPRWRPSGR
jgi:putative ATP-dependent DNA ligase